MAAGPIVQRPVARRPGAAAAGFDAKESCGEPWDDEDDLVLKQWERMDIGALALATATSVVKRRPVLVSAWVFGLLLAAFAGGLPVDALAGEAYSNMLQRAEVIDSRELGRSLEQLQKDEEVYYGARGWFGACDADCERAHDKVQMTRGEVLQLQGRRDKVLSEARQEVGIWSSFGVQDVRNAFWSAWKSGKEFAARCTMMDMLFLNVGGGREQTLVTLVLQLVVRYTINLTMGLIGALFYFIYNVYCLIVSYGEPALSGLAFLLLATVAGLTTVGTYLGVVFGTVAGGGLMLMRQAALQAVTAGPGRAPGKLQHSPCPSPRCNV